MSDIKYLSTFDRNKILNKYISEEDWKNLAIAADELNSYNTNPIHSILSFSKPITVSEIFGKMEDRDDTHIIIPLKKIGVKFKHLNDKTFVFTDGPFTEHNLSKHILNSEKKYKNIDEDLNDFYYTELKYDMEKDLYFVN